MPNPLERLIAQASALYEDSALAAAVCDHAVQNKTVDKILRGELVLPYVEDARRWHEATTGKQTADAESAAKDARIAELERRLMALEGHIRQTGVSE